MSSFIRTHALDTEERGGIVQEVPDWIHVFTVASIPEGNLFAICMKLYPTCEHIIVNFELQLTLFRLVSFLCMRLAA